MEPVTIKLVDPPVYRKRIQHFDDIPVGQGAGMYTKYKILERDGMLFLKTGDYGVLEEYYFNIAEMIAFKNKDGTVDLHFKSKEAPTVVRGSAPKTLKRTFSIDKYYPIRNIYLGVVLKDLQEDVYPNGRPHRCGKTP